MATNPTRIRTGSRGRLFVEEHIKRAKSEGLSVEHIAGRVGVNRTTVHKWINEHHRLDPLKLDQLAIAIGLKDGREFWRPPGHSPLDDMSPEELETTANEIVKRLRKSAS